MVATDVGPHAGATAALGLIDLVGCMASIAAIKASLAYRGFARTLARIRARTPNAMDGADAPDEVAARLDRIVSIAAAFYPGRALCLERSLVLYDRLRRAGAHAEFRLGVQAVPFASHAWVERHGAPLNDVLERTEQFTPVPLGAP